MPERDDPASPDGPAVGPPATITELLTWRADHDAERVFLVVDDRSITFGELDRLATQVAAGLRSWGIRPGDRVAVAAPNGLPWLGLFFGATRLGAALVTLNPRYREQELRYMLNQSSARLLLCPASTPELDFAAFFAVFRTEVPTVERYVFLDPPTEEGRFEGVTTFDELLTAGDATEVGEPTSAEGEGAVTGRPTGADGGPAPSDPAVILYTSGTTGKPRGAVLTHASLLASARAQVAHLGWDEHTSTVGSLPLNHVGGLTCGILSLLVAGGTVVLLPAFSPSAVLAATAEHRTTVLSGVPTMFVMLLQALAANPVDVDSLRQVIVGGSILDPSLAEQVAAAWPDAQLVNLYGLSESSGASVLSAPGDDLDMVTRSIGVVIGDFEGRVVDESGNPVAPGIVGELQLRGACVAAGYWEMPEETAETFLPGGWLATGDMVEAEADGHLAVRGRKKELYIQGGFNVYPAEVEAVLGTHPAVALAAGFGVPDPVYGEVGAYVVVPRPGAAVDPDELRSWCAARLADYKVPRYVTVAPEVPLTPAGKVAKAELRRRFEAGA
ncbi:MAG: AMP-binding protein [Actinomycetota bacterium]|nr:AMP-binding protein [Actinomycetota bacterium]